MTRRSSWRLGGLRPGLGSLPVIVGRRDVSLPSARSAVIGGAEPGHVSLGGGFAVQVVRSKRVAMRTLGRGADVTYSDEAPPPASKIWLDLRAICNPVQRRATRPRIDVRRREVAVVAAPEPAVLFVSSEAPR